MSADQDPLAVIGKVGEACRQAVLDAADAGALQQVKQEVLGRKGRVNALMDLIKEAAPEQRGQIGQSVNKLKKGTLT